MLSHAPDDRMIEKLMTCPAKSVDLNMAFQLRLDLLTNITNKLTK
jgi:hypothetical protein